MKPSVRFHSARNALNNQIIWPILLVLFLAPFAFGSTKPAFWTLWSTILFGCGTYSSRAWLRPMRSFAFLREACRSRWPCLRASGFICSSR